MDTDRPTRRRMIAEMTGVRSYGNEPDVELWLNESGRLVIVAYNEAGCAATEVDLWDILNWVRVGQAAELVLGEDNPTANLERIVRSHCSNEESAVARPSESFTPSDTARIGCRSKRD
jgi:hypothetical protein